jgi:pimeloyl-ACP methyl ester carboxylesterase
MSMSIEQFQIHVDDAVLEDLHHRLARTRLPDQIGGSGWEYGIPIDYLGQLVEYWRDTYDWRAQEARLNDFSHFRTRIDEQSIHFIHARSAHADALPLLITHGWPGSIAEFLDVIPRLTDPEAFGGQAADAFHVVAPSLPGYGFSEPPRTPGWDERRIARAFVALMSRLGYTRYGAQGGDWGAQVTTRIAGLDPEHCAAIHLNMALASPPDEPIPLTEEEQMDLAAMKQFRGEESGYANEQGTKPQTLGAALNDSPAGLLAWIVEKFRAWSDCDGHPENCFTRDQLITNVMLYWVTQTSASAARLYWESRHGDPATTALPFVDAPTGIARYPKEPLRLPRSWIERQYNVSHWAVMEHGGHFAAMEQPEEFAADLRTCFRRVRQPGAANLKTSRATPGRRPDLTAEEAAP